MAIEKPMTPTDIAEIVNGEEDQELDIEIIESESMSFEDEDGGMTIVLESGTEESMTAPDHQSNLAEFIDESDLE